MTAPALPIRELSRAVLIGASAFQHAEPLPPLPAVNRNITDLADALTNSETGVLDPDHCTTVYTPDSPRSLLSQLKPVAKQAEDLLIVYYAGHGLRDLNRDTLYLAVRETDPDELDGTAVPYEFVREIVAASTARTKLLILDCCYSGMAIGRMSSAGVDSEEVAVRGTSVITSSPRNKKSLSPPGELHTAFTSEVLSLLKNGPRIPGRQLDAAELFRSVTTAMARRELPEPKMSTVDTASMVVLRRTADTPPAPTSPAPKPAVVPEPRPRTIRTPAAPAASTTVAPPPVSPPVPEPPRRSATAPATPPEPEPPPRSVAAPVTTPEPVRQESTAPTATSAGPELKSWSDVTAVAVGHAKRAVQPNAVLSVARRWGLWIGLVMGAAMGIGGVVGGIFAKKSDLTTGIVMVLVGAACGVVIRLRVLKARRDDNPSARLEDTFPALGRLVDRVGTPVLWIVIVGCLALAIAGILQPATPTSQSVSRAAGTVDSQQASQMSDLTLTVGLVALLLEIAAGCGYVLVVRRRASRGGSAGR